MQTDALQEDRAAENLNAWGVETFAPKYKERRSNAFTGRPVYTRSLFPRYMFARFDAARMLRKVWFTRGVAKVVGFGDGPSPVDDEILENQIARRRRWLRSIRRRTKTWRQGCYPRWSIDKPRRRFRSRAGRRESSTDATYGHQLPGSIERELSEEEWLTRVRPPHLMRYNPR